MNSTWSEHIEIPQPFKYLLHTMPEMRGNKGDYMWSIKNYSTWSLRQLHWLLEDRVKPTIAEIKCVSQKLKSCSNWTNALKV